MKKKEKLFDLPVRRSDKGIRSSVGLLNKEAQLKRSLKEELLQTLGLKHIS